MSTPYNRRKVLKTGAAALTAGLIPNDIVTAVKDRNQNESSRKTEYLTDHAVTHGGIQRVAHPRLKTDVHGQTCIRYLRFRRQIEIDQLELGKIRYGRWVPYVPTHPAHIIISALDPDTLRWKTVREVNLPPEPEIMGKGLSQDMKIEKMEEHFSRILEKPPHRIKLDGFRTDHLRVICDREHPVFPNHGECNGGPYNVPFGILNNLRVSGIPESPELPLMPYNPILKRKTIRPEAPKGMKVRDLSQMLLFEGKYLSVGFSLRRPVLMHLGWDILGEGHASHNRLFASRQHSKFKGICGLNGPVVRTLQSDYPPHLWSGEVSVEGNRIIYHNLHAFEGMTIDVVFTVEKDCINVELRQTSKKNIPVIESEAWRLIWDLKQGITGMAGKPTLLTGRNGDVELPAVWATDFHGCLSCSKTGGDSGETRFHVESYRFDDSVSGGFVFGKHPGTEKCSVIEKGTQQAAFELALTNLEPKRKIGAPEPSAAIKRQWATVFSCFRPEYRGFSNHSASVNCHVNQGPPIEIVAHTAHHPDGLNPLDLARFTIERAILGGGGYGYWRNLYLDSDPILVSAAGRIHQADPDVNWLRRIEPGIVETVNRMMGLRGEEGLLVCRDLSGNSGSYRWSSNAMDVVGFGHIDGYVNAWAYRAFRNAAAMLDDLSGHRELASRCREAARRIRDRYTAALLNPETGWIAGWRSRDGRLHDYAFTWVNGPALAFGLVEGDVARKALTALEQIRAETGPGDARMGIPLNLIPIREEDHMLARILKQIQPTFETYTDGSLSGSPATYYLRALAIHGLRDNAQKMAKEMAKGYAEGIFNGGLYTGHEFRSWEGLPTGYEGTLIVCFGPMYAMAIEEGIFDPPEPEWWPQNG